jgi:hypothetical protein
MRWQRKGASEDMFIYCNTNKMLTICFLLLDVIATLLATPANPQG